MAEWETTAPAALTIDIHIPGEPHAQGRARHSPLMRGGTPVIGRGGRPVVITYDPTESRSWKAYAKECIRQVIVNHWLPSAAGFCVPLEGPLSLSVLALFTMPAGRFLKRGVGPRAWKTGKPDTDNILKAVKDAASGLLWLDDKQVVNPQVWKVVGAQGEAPGIWLRVRTLTDADIPPGLPPGF